MNDKGIQRTLMILKIVVTLLLALLLMYFSVYSIQPQEHAVILTFGAPTVVRESGLHFKIPFIQKKRIVPMVINNFSIGYNSTTEETLEFESLMITSDYNFVNVDFFVEYKVSDPIEYCFASDEPEKILRMMALSYIRDTIGLYPVDSVITTGKSEIEAEIREKLTKRLTQEKIGLSLHNIRIQDATPPTEEVMSAFKAVETAKQGKETAINNANKYKNEREPAALAQVDAVLKNAEAEKEARINEARGQVARFNAMYEEYQKYPLITKQRMYYEAIEEILPGLKVIIDNEGGSTSRMLPLEPFSEAKGVE